MNSVKAKLFVLLQYLLPRFTLTRIAAHVAQIRTPAIKNFIINRFIQIFNVNTEEVEKIIPHDFKNFNAFFTRELKADARPFAECQEFLCSPVDGTVSANGSIAKGHLYQAKGLKYSLEELLGCDTQDTEALRDCPFSTIYLAPYNYHRIHAPCDAYLESMHYIPGDLFSVNESTVKTLRNLFVRNERLVCRLQTAKGLLIVVFVGALNVGSIYTPWTGNLRPQRKGLPVSINLDTDNSRQLKQGDLMGWFNFGSTVIVLGPSDSKDLNFDLQNGQTVIAGQTIELV